MNKFRQLRIAALLFTIVFLISSVPISGYGRESTQSAIGITEGSSDMDVEEYGASPNNETQEELVLSEVVSRREENVKHFDLGHGRFQAVAYGNAVHRKDENGVWQDIDNRLYPAKDRADLYATADGRTTVSAYSHSSKALITLRENGYVIALAPVFTQTAEKLKAASAVEIQNHKENKIDSDRTLSIKDAAEASNTTTVRYADVFSSVDVEYLLSGNDIKENIIVNDAQNEYTYSFALAVVNLTPELKPTGEIVLSDSSTGTEEYWIPAPYMYDANGEVSYDVSYELSGAKGAYILRVVAEKKWINSDDRAFPVVIDPTIKKTILYDTYISSAAPTTNYGTSSELWISSGKISFLKQEMPTLPDGCEFHAAKLYVYYYYYDKVTDGSLTAGAYQVLHSWSESGTSGLTWNMASPSTNTYISSTRLSAGPFSGSRGAYANSPKTVSFDVTSAAEAWYEGTSPNYGIALKYEGGTNSSVILKSCEAGSLYRAYYIITYTEPEIVSGVYKIKNAANGLYLDVDNGGATAGTRVQQWSTATEANKRNQLFKITFVQTYDTNTKLNYYTIRPMTNSALGLETALSGSRNATISTMSVNDSWAELTGNQLWAISKDGSYYTLKNGMPSANSYLTAPASATNGEAVYTADSAGTTSQWILEPYTGEALNGVRKLSGALNLITGEELTYQICMYSSAVGVNGPVRYSVKNTDGTATDKATIEESTGHLTALKPGQIKIRATYTGAPYIWFWTATIEESMEGTWFIQNRHESLYMQVDDDDEPNYANDGGIAEVRSFDGADYQKWIFTNAGDGYYKITSKISGYAVTVPSGEETEEDVDLVLKPYTGSNNQKWKITLTSYGSYKIKAKSSESITDRDLVMVVQTNILYSEGLNIQQRQYVDNTSYKDEWILQPYSVVFYGVTNSGHDHISSLNSIQTTMLNGNWKSVTVRSGAITANQCKNDLLSTNVFTSRSHGQLVLRAGTTTEVSTGIVLNDNDGSNKVVFYGHAWNGMESGSGSIDSGENYSNIDVVLFIGCNTAYGGNGGRNLPAAIVDQGARAAVGFKDSIDCVEANTWTTNFYNKMLQGATLQEAVDYACGEFSENSPLRSAVICGDETVTLI